ncbi:acetyl esterase [Comamonas sp. BIGb0124]|uniref:alpha/beta hydrolase n=1 Tax=Comamonas sp. BIGb0124 TaxID=2485130 RepID=UPI000FA9AAC3|nr:alpha/beta hydrolase [Comamonas sp. BIGb0124]ROR26489.1 acetyl esterase [Comamonas sp. BIGb0124]
MKSQPTYPAPAPMTAAMRDVIDRMARAGRPPLHSLTPDEARAAYEKGANVLEVPLRALHQVQDRTLPARDGVPLPVRLYRPTSEPGLPVVLYLHGGGFTVGSVRTHDALCREIAGQAGCAVVSLDYRLAPQHKFPTAAHDAWDACSALASGALDDWGLDGRRLAVCGDSAGGTLAAVCAILARDAGLPLALQALIYPGCTGHQDTASHHTYADGHVLTREGITWFFEHYIRDARDRDDWRFAPLYADDLEGVAPAWIGLAECDPLVDEGVQYADRLRMAGVPVELDIYRGVTHEFIKMGRALPEARKAHTDLAAVIRAALA